MVVTTDRNTLNFADNVFGVSIKSNMYDDSGAAKITFNGDGAAVGDNAFQNCATLTEISLPLSVKSVGNQAFQNCSALVSALLSWMQIRDPAQGTGEHHLHKVGQDDQETILRILLCTD